MIPRKNRLSRGEFAVIAASPTLVRTDIGGLKARRGAFKCGVVVSKKNIPTAVARHRARRRAYAAIAKQNITSMAVVWYLTAAVTQLPFAELTRKLDDMLAVAWSRIAQH